MNLTSPAYRVAHTSPKEFDTFVADLKKRCGRRWRSRPATRFGSARPSSPGHSREFGVIVGGAAKKVRAKMLVIVSPQDHLVNPIPAQEFAERLPRRLLLWIRLAGTSAWIASRSGPTVANFLPILLRCTAKPS